MSASRPGCLGVEGSCLPHEEDLALSLPTNFPLPPSQQLVLPRAPAPGRLLDQPRRRSLSRSPHLLTGEFCGESALTGWGCPQLCWAPGLLSAAAGSSQVQDSPWQTGMGCLIISPGGNEV